MTAKRREMTTLKSPRTCRLPLCHRSGETIYVINRRSHSHPHSLNTEKNTENAIFT
jgi:hypothetical protein